MKEEYYPLKRSSISDKKFAKIVETREDIEKIGFLASNFDVIYKILDGAAFSVRWVLRGYKKKSNYIMKNTEIVGSKKEIVNAKSLLEKMLDTKLVRYARYAK